MLPSFRILENPVIISTFKRLFSPKFFILSLIIYYGILYVLNKANLAASTAFLGALGTGPGAPFIYLWSIVALVFTPIRPGLFIFFVFTVLLKREISRTRLSSLKTTPLSPQDVFFGIAAPIMLLMITLRYLVNFLWTFYMYRASGFSYVVDSQFAYFGGSVMAFAYNVVTTSIAAILGTEVFLPSSKPPIFRVRMPLIKFIMAQIVTNVVSMLLISPLANFILSAFPWLGDLVLTGIYTINIAINAAFAWWFWKSAMKNREWWDAEV